MKGSNEKFQKDLDGKHHTDGKGFGDKPTNEKPPIKEHKDKEHFIGEKQSYEGYAIAGALAGNAQKELSHEKPTHKESHKDKEIFIGEKLSYEGYAVAGTLAGTAQKEPTPEKHVKLEHKEVKEKYEKEGKFEKFELKELDTKHPKTEKFEHKEIEKALEGFGGSPIEQRLAALEQGLSLLQHFIPQEARPDLVAAALRLEQDRAKAAIGTKSSTETKKSPRKKKPKS
jgi:hypothetical protein